MTGVEIDMVVTDSLKALELYERIIGIERLEVTDLPRGTNEAVYTLYGTRFHMLDENPAYELHAPDRDAPRAIWFNVVVPDIGEAFSKAIDAGCTGIQPVIEIPAYGVSNALFSDPYGHLWMLHQIHREVSLEERMQLWQDSQSH